jgi:hypothetical protein
VSSLRIDHFTPPVAYINRTSFVGAGAKQLRGVCVSDTVLLASGRNLSLGQVQGRRAARGLRAAVQGAHSRTRSLGCAEAHPYNFSATVLACRNSSR